MHRWATQTTCDDQSLRGTWHVSFANSASYAPGQPSASFWARASLDVLVGVRQVHNQNRNAITLCRALARAPRAAMRMPRRQASL